METEQPALFHINDLAMYVPKVFADHHEIPLQTVYSAINSGRIISHRFGGRVYLVASSADTYALLYKATKETKGSS